MINIDLPWPPTINHMYGRRPSGGVYLLPAGKHFRAEVWVMFKAAKGVKQEGRLAMFITVYPPDKRRRDLDNIVKAVQDGLMHAGAYEDDCQIDGLRVERAGIVQRGKVNVVICAHRTAGQTGNVWKPSEQFA